MKKRSNNIEADKLKGVLITRTAIKTLVPEDIVEKVIMFQFKDFRSVMQEHEQIEVSGFGKFMTSPNKIRKKIEKMEYALMNVERKRSSPPEGTTEKRLKFWDDMIEQTKQIIACLKTKKGGYENKSKRHTGGSMELPVCEEGDRGDSSSEK